jgi:DNA-binding NarL/FixJ family response regulator
VDGPAGAGRRILVADDADETRMLVRIAVESAHVGQVVGEAADGGETVRLVEELRPDLVVLDLAMPGFDGLESLVALRERVPGLRVVVHTGSAADGLAEQVLDAGSLGYVVKGSPLSELLRAVRRALDAPGPR